MAILFRTIDFVEYFLRLPELRMIENIPPDITAAQIQANATIEAARIGASATLRAARIGGLYTLCGGVFLIIGALMAYRATLRQIRLSEHHATARVTAFKLRLKNEIAKIRETTGRIAYQIDILSIAAIESRDFEVTSQHYELLKDIYWEEHALLGSTVVGSISVLRSSVDILNEISLKGTQESLLLDEEMTLPAAFFINDKSDNSRLVLDKMSNGQVVFGLCKKISETSEALLIALGVSKDHFLKQPKWAEVEKRLHERCRNR